VIDGRQAKLPGYRGKRKLKSGERSELEPPRVEKKGRGFPGCGGKTRKETPNNTKKKKKKHSKKKKRKRRSSQ